MQQTFFIDEENVNINVLFTGSEVTISISKTMIDQFITALTGGSP